MPAQQYLLDTNVLIDMFRGDKNVRQAMLDAKFTNCRISEITIAELFYGAAKGGWQRNFEDITNVLRMFDVVPIYASLETYGRMKAELERQGQRIDDFDLLIGATALYKGYTLVTANTKHFARIPNLRIENWKE